MPIPSPFCLALFSSTLLFLSCVSVPVPDAREVGEAFERAEVLSCKLSKKPTLVPDAMITSSARFIPSRSGIEPTDLAGAMLARLAATHTIQTFSGVSDSIASRIVRDSTPLTIEWSRSAPETAPKTLSACDLKKFLKIFREDVLSLATYTQETAPGTHTDPSLLWIFKKYFTAYIDGEFVDRNGRKYPEPHLKDKIPNDVIVAPLAIFLEAFFDLKLNYPILVDGDANDLTYYPAGNKNKPTAATLRLDNLPVIPIVKIVPDDTMCGITRREAKAIGFGSRLAASGSAMQSGLVFEALGDVEVAFVVGGNFSVGDNETLATLVKTIFEVVSRRLTERALYDLLYTHGISGTPDHISESEQRIEGFLSDF